LCVRACVRVCVCVCLCVQKRNRRLSNKIPRSGRGPLTGTAYMQNDIIKLVSERTLPITPKLHISGVEGIKKDSKEHLYAPKPLDFLVMGRWKIHYVLQHSYLFSLMRPVYTVGRPHRSLASRSP